MGSFENSSRFFKSVKSSNLNQSSRNKSKEIEESRSTLKGSKGAKIMQNWSSNQENNKHTIENEIKDNDIISIGSLNSDDSKLEYSEQTDDSCK